MTDCAECRRDSISGANIRATHDRLAAQCTSATCDPSLSPWAFALVLSAGSHSRGNSTLRFFKGVGLSSGTNGLLIRRSLVRVQVGSHEF
jgi:hypothetical protein